MSAGRFARAALAVAALGGCSVGDLDFRIDDRLEIVAPDDRDELTLPYTFRWTVRDFELSGPSATATPNAGMVAVFLDRTPVRPGQDVEALLTDDELRRCADDHDCVAEALADHRVWVTTGLELTLDRIAAPPDRRGDPHRMTVVLVDGSGHRVGEGAASVEFRVAEGS